MTSSLEKSLLVVTANNPDKPNSFTCAVKDTGIDTSGSHFTFGTTVFFKPNANVTRQSGGIAIFADSTSNSGYFIRIKTSQTAGIYGDEVRIFKIVSGSIEKVFSENMTIGKDIRAIQEGKTYKIDIFAEHTGSVVKIKAFINGSKISVTDTTSVIPKSSNISLFANYGSGYFDYAYAIKISQDQFDSPVLTDIYKSQFAKAIVNLTYGEFFSSGIEKIESGTTDRYVEEFGSIAREIRYFKKRYDAAPSLPKFTYENLNSNIKVLYSNLMPFEAEIYAINNAGVSTLVDSSLGTQINVLGNNLVKTSGLVYEEDKINKYAYQEPIVFESNWMQNESDAQELSTFIKSQWTKSNIVLQLQVFGNPVLSVYDIITISHQFSEINPNQKFIITNIKHSWNDGLETSITARSLTLVEESIFMNIHANIAAEGSAFVVDSESNVYMMSLDYRGPDYDKMHFLTKMDNDGNFLWEIRIDDLEDEEYEEFSVVGLDIDNSNNIYIALSITEGYPYTLQDLLYIIKIDSNGNLIWGKFIGNSSYNNYATYQGGKFKAVQCRLDSNLNLYVTANVQAKTLGNPVHHLVMKLDPSGNILWQKIHSDTTPGSDSYYSYGLDLDSSNNLYTISGGSSTVLTKYDPSGNILFVKKINGLGLGAAGPTDIVIDNNDIYISLNRSLPSTPSTFDSATHIIKINNSGNIVWERYIGDQPFLNAYYQTSLSSVKNNSFFITLPNYSGGTNTDFVIVKMDTSGNYLSQKKITKPLNVTPSASTTQTIPLDIDQTSSNLYCSGVIKPGNETSFIFKIPNSLSEEYAISFTNAVVYDDDDPLNPYSESKSFNINIENTSLYSPTTSSYLSLSDYTDYGTINSPFTLFTSSIIFNKTITPDLIETKGTI